MLNRFAEITSGAARESNLPVDVTTSIDRQRLKILQEQSCSLLITDQESDNLGGTRERLDSFKARKLEELKDEAETPDLSNMFIFKDIDSECEDRIMPYNVK